MKLFKICSAVTLLAVVSTAGSINAETTYCNPIDLPYRYALGNPDAQSASFREAADPTIVLYKGDYYLFASKCGVYYYSPDLVNWTAVHTDALPMEGYAPTAIEWNGKLYFTHSVGTSKMWRTDNPKTGKWELIQGAGTEKDENDPMLFADGDRMYLFYGSSGNPDDGIMGVEFDTTTFRPKGTPVRLLTANRSRFGWEVMGDYNEQPERNPWLEGVWVTKHDGKYYLQYSAPGTECKSYCDAVYVSDSPLGPYTIQSHNPFSYRPEGFMTAAGHGSTFQDKNGNWWHISTGTISRRHMFERRLVLYPVFFDADGLMWCDTSFGDFPLTVPDFKTDSPDSYHTDWMLLSAGKPVTVSSTQPGHPAEYAVNEDVRSWWSASSGEKGEWFMIDLENLCRINALQINFADEESGLQGYSKDVYQYTVDISVDGKKWKTLSDRRKYKQNAPHAYIQLPKAENARFVRITNSHCPSGKFSLSGFRVFGNANGNAPVISRIKSAVRNPDDLRQVNLCWSKSNGASGYNIRYGISPEKAYQNYTVYGDTSLTIRSLDAESDYYFCVDAFNDSGIAKGSDFIKAPVDSTTFTNPVLYTDVPDPDIIRVGDTFYMVSTTMHFSPGCQIMKSKDLVNWEALGFAYEQLEESDGFALKNGQNDYSRGSWAANLRYDSYEKMYYLIVTCNTTQKSYIFTTPDIEKGRWHRNVVDMCYDPGLLFDDNGTECKKYVIHPDYNLGLFTAYIREIISDGKGNVRLGDKERLIDYTQMENPSEGLRAEGYHGYKIGDFYYIFMIQGQGAQRQEIVWRAKELKRGAFEARKIFTGDIVNEDGSHYLPFTGVAQGGIVDLPDRRWYAFLFQDYGAVGRMPVIMPMRWEDGWPILGNDGKSVDRRQIKPIQGGKMSFPVVNDEFENCPDRYVISDVESSNPEYAWNGSSLKREWQWNHNPDNRFWSLKERNGYLRLKTPAVATSIRDARNTLTQRTFGPTSKAETVCETEGMRNGDCAGLASFQNRYGFVGVKMENGKKYIVMHRAQEKDDSKGVEVERVPFDGNRVYLRVECDFRNMTDKVYFWYSLDGMHWQRIGDELQMYFDWPDFVGQRFALFNFATAEVGGYVDFDYFRVSGNIRIK